MRSISTPRRCRATTRKGTICAITSSSTLKDELGRDVAEPLRRGGNHCMFHARPFCTIPAEDFTGAALQAPQECGGHAEESPFPRQARWNTSASARLRDVVDDSL